MGEMLFTDALIFQGKRGFVKGSLSVSERRISDIKTDPYLPPDREPADEKKRALLMEGSQSRHKAFSGKETQDDALRGDGRPGIFCKSGCRKEDEISIAGMYLIPGLIDLHIHGSSGYDFSDADLCGLYKMGRYLAFNGITSFAPASMTLPYERLEAAFKTAADYKKKRPLDGAKLAGIHMEGPFFSEKKRGAQNAAYLKKPDIEGFRALQESCGQLIRIVDLAPELEGACDFIRNISGECKVSVAHTDASYEEACRAFDAGASHLTHLFNAMPPLNHRNPGVIGAAAERENLAAELICDSLHVHPSVVRLAFKLFPGRICLISDALRCLGMPDGEYELGGQKVIVRERQARLEDNTLAGAVSSLFDDMVNAVSFGISKEEAILSATLIPARELGIDDECGSLEKGKAADFLVCDESWNLKMVYLDGVRIR